MMKNQNKPIFWYCWFLVIVLLSLHSTPTSSQEVEDESEFDYIKGSKKGPAHWGEIKKEWEACNNGDLQSPIDLSNKRVKLAPLLLGINLRKNYKPANATIKNRGHDIALEWEGDAGSILINKTNYFLQQGHWHSPSEHTVNGRRYDLELHMVHVSENNSIVVVALFYKMGRKSNRFISKLTKDLLRMIEKREDEREKGVIDPRKIMKNDKLFYRYMGSLTVPPCTEGVNWIIHKKISTVSLEQVEILRAAVHDSAEMNARPLQPQNGREIFYGRISRKKHTHH